MAAQAPPGAPDAAASGADDKRYLYTLFLVYLAALSIAAGAAVWAGYAGHDFGSVATVVGAIVALVPAMEIVGRRDDRNEVTQHRLTFLVAFALALVGAALAAAVLSVLSEDVTGRAELAHASDMGNGSTARLSVEAKPSGDELNVTIEAEDRARGAATSCLPLGRLRFGGPDLAEDRTAALDDELTQKLPLRAAGPRVNVTVTLLHADDGCRVALTLKRANYR